MQICFNEMTVLKSGKLTDTIRACGQVGFGQLEILKGSLYQYLRKGGSLGELKALLDQNRVSVASLNAIDSFSFLSKADSRKLKENATLLMACCKALGSPCMEIIASFGITETDWETVKQNTADAIGMLSDLASDFGICLALEFMATPGSSIQSFAQGLEVIRAADRRNVGLLLDTWHFHAAGAHADDILSLGLKPEEVFMVHVSDAPACEPYGLPRAQSFYPGEGAIDFAGILNNLKTIGYDGPVSLEIANPEIQALPANETIQKSYASMNELFKRCRLL